MKKRSRSYPTAASIFDRQDQTRFCTAVEQLVTTVIDLKRVVVDVLDQLAAYQPLAVMVRELLPALQAETERRSQAAAKANRTRKGNLEVDARTAAAAATCAEGEE